MSCKTETGRLAARIRPKQVVLVFFVQFEFHFCRVQKLKIIHLWALCDTTSTVFGTVGLYIE